MTTLFKIMCFHLELLCLILLSLNFLGASQRIDGYVPCQTGEDSIEMLAEGLFCSKRHCATEKQNLLGRTQCCCFFVLEGVTLPTGGDWVEYYLIHNGSDTSMCGRSVDSACLSLKQVLMLYHAKPPTKGLQIITDMSLLIDSNILVSTCCGSCHFLANRLKVCLSKYVWLVLFSNIKVLTCFSKPVKFSAAQSCILYHFNLD